MKKILFLFALAAAVSCAPCVAPVSKTVLEGTLIREHVADPCLIYDDGLYYLTSTGGSRLIMVKDSSIAGLSNAASPASEAPVIYDSAQDPTVAQLYGEGAVINGVWSPEIHYFSEEDFPGNSGWYLYFGLRQKYSDRTGTSRNIRMVVLKSASGKVDGPYVSPVTGEAFRTQPVLGADGAPIDRWAVGPSVLRVPSGPYKGAYLMWIEETGRGEGYGKFYQKIMISHFSSPWQLEGEPGVITTPTQEWERHGADEKRPCVVEGATAVYGDHGEVFLTYCGSGYWSDYGIGQLTLKRKGRRFEDPLKTESWVKYEGNPIFSSVQSEDLRGAGHGFFLRSASGGRFICYHAFPFVGGVKVRSRNAYLEPYSIDKSASCPSAPDGVIRMGALGTGVTAPVESTRIEF